MIYLVVLTHFKNTCQILSSYQVGIKKSNAWNQMYHFWDIVHWVHPCNKRDSICCFQASPGYPGAHIAQILLFD